MNVVAKGAASSIGRNLEDVSVSDSAGVKNDSFANISSQAGFPSLVKAAELITWAAGRTGEAGGTEGTSIIP